MALAGGLVKRRRDTPLSQVDGHPQGEEAAPDQGVPGVGERPTRDDIGRSEREQRRRPGIAGHAKTSLTSEGVRSRKRGGGPRSIDEEGRDRQPKKDPVPKYDVVEQLGVRSR